MRPAGQLLARYSRNGPGTRQLCAKLASYWRVIRISNQLLARYLHNAPATCWLFAQRASYSQDVRTTGQLLTGYAHNSVTSWLLALVTSYSPVIRTGDLRAVVHAGDQLVPGNRAQRHDAVRARLGPCSRPTARLGP